MVSIGDLVFIAVKPMLKLILSAGFGFVMARKDLLSVGTSRGISQIIMNITLPCLLFASMVPSFTPDNVASIGTLLFVACFYQAMGIVWAIIARTLFYVPTRFRHGILVAGGWGNVGDLPNAIIMAITAGAPFKEDGSDATLSVAYVGIFILVFFVTLFPLGGNHLLERDYRDYEPDAAADEAPIAPKWQRRLQVRVTTLRNRRRSAAAVDADRPMPEELELAPLPPPSAPSPPPLAHVHKVDFAPDLEADQSPSPRRPGLSRATSMHDSTVAQQSDWAGPTSTLYDGDEATRTPKEDKPSPPILLGDKGTSKQPKTIKEKALRTLISFLRSLMTPATISLACSLIVALVQPLKALFVEVEGTNIPMAPDGNPPLSFIFDTAKFVSGASVPLGLIVLGASLGRLHIPRPISKLPLGSILSLAVLKVCVGPIIGVAFVQALTYHTTLIDPENKPLRFVCMFMSALPTATTQIVLTSIVAPDGNTDTISAFLVPQYILMLFSMTVLSAYALSLL